MQFLLRRVPALVCLPALLFFALSLSAQQTLTVAKLVDFIKSSIQQKNQDKDVAGALAKMKLSEKLSPTVVEDLQSAGAGPKTVAALAALVTQTASLNSAPPKTVITVPQPTGPKEPSAADKRVALEEARDFALNYVKSLPDFLCMQVTRRSVDNHFQVGSEGSWTPQDRLLEKLTFFDHKENYELIQHNDNAVVGKNWESIGGSYSRGEWATLLSEVFEPATHTDFNWLRWGTLRGHLSHVYEYRIEQQYSQETISYQNEQKITAGFHGLVYIEKGTNIVLRLTVIPDIPASFPVQDVNQIVDYDYQEIGTQTHLLPLRSQVQMRDGHQASKNEIEWRQYRKYSADFNIKFDTTESGTGSEDKPAEEKPADGNSKDKAAPMPAATQKK